MTKNLFSVYFRVMNQLPHIFNMGLTCHEYFSSFSERKVLLVTLDSFKETRTKGKEQSS